MGLKTKIGLFAVAALLVAAAFSMGWNDRREIKVMQNIQGVVDVKFDGGPFWSTLSKTKTYPRQDTFYFSKHADEGESYDESVPVAFKNNSKGYVTGSVRYAYPLTEVEMKALDADMGSPEAVKLDLVRNQMRKLVSLTASIMSPEAAMAQKGKFYQMLLDQANNGPYKTLSVEETIVDPATGESRTQEVVKLVYDRSSCPVVEEGVEDACVGEPVRLADDFDTYHLKLSLLTITDIDVDDKTDELINKRRDSEIKLTVAKANRAKSEQEKLTAIAEGKKNVETKRYEALVLKEEQVVNADREKEVAEIKAQQLLEVEKKGLEQEQVALDKALLEAKRIKAIANAEAFAKREILKADGALTQTLAAEVEINTRWAEAYKNRNVPTTVLYGGNGKGKGPDTGMAGIVEMFQTTLATKIDEKIRQ